MSTLSSFMRDTAGGFVLHLLSGRRILKHPEDQKDFVVPEFKTLRQIKREKAAEAQQRSQKKSGSSASSQDTAVEAGHANADKSAREEAATAEGIKEGVFDEAVADAGARDEKSGLAERGKSTTAMTEDDLIVVDWYGPDDPANPQNWSKFYKYLFLGVLMWLTFNVYMGASIISPGIPILVEQYGVSELVAGLTIALYVLGYGLGPLIFSPLSEIPQVGRLVMYVVPLFLFFAVGFASAFTPTFGGLLAVRFITGFLASPALATGGASVGDVLSPLYMPLGLCLWVVAAYQGPGLGPTIVGFAVERFQDWHWCFYIYQIFVATCVATVFFLMPESSGPNILHRRAERIRRLTGDKRYQSMGEIQSRKLTITSILSDAIKKPFEITLKDPSVAYVNIYVSLLYAFYYLFFAAFPIIFFEEYGFGIGTGELPYITIAVGGAIFCAAYMALYRFVVVPAILSGEAGEPEDTLLPALPFSIVSAISLFLVGWTAGRTHWMAPIVFTAIFGGSNFIVLQPLFAYLSMAYPTYAASLFAANDAMRSTFAFGFLIAGTPLFRTLGIGPGCSLTGGLTALCVPGVFILKWKGKQLRQRSRFAVSDVASEPETK